MGEYCCLSGWVEMRILRRPLRNWERSACLIVLGVGLILAGQPLAASSGDVVINEVAWMGTAASSSDEWIELKNNTAQDIDLSGWSLKAADGTPEIVLSGSISANGFFLLERTGDDTVSDVVADQLYGTDYYTWALHNAGEHLVLTNNAGVIIDEIDASTGWSAGQASPDYLTMERVNSSASGNELTNWRSNDPAIAQNGMDADSNPLNGTSKARNSATNPPTADFACVPEHPTTWDAIQFTDRSSDIDGTIITWLWTFGDGDFAIEQNPRHQYQIPKTYQVILEVTDSDGLKGSTFRDVAVSLGPGDVDGSGTLDVLDVRIVLQAALGLVALTPDQVLQADVDGDGQVTRGDAERLAAHVIGIGD